MRHENCWVFLQIFAKRKHSVHQNVECMDFSYLEVHEGFTTQEMCELIA